MTVVPLYTVKE